MFQIYLCVSIFQLLAVISIPLGKVHFILNNDLLQWLPLNWSCVLGVQEIIYPVRLFVTYFDVGNLRYSFHTACLCGFFSIGWCGHLVQFEAYLFGPVLTFLGGLKSNTLSLYLTDIAHHHLGVGILFVWFGHVYVSLEKGFGHRIRCVFHYEGVLSLVIAQKNSLHLQLSLALAGCCVITSVVGQQMYSLTPYLYLSYDYIRTVGLYVHHSWIASFLMMGSFAHSGIFLIRDYTINKQSWVCRILAHKTSIISSLLWLCLWLGFHTLGLYIHNDTLVAFGEIEKQILIEPVFAQIIQESSACDSWIYGISILEFNTLAFIFPLGPGDLLAHHAIALGLHITVLILLKGSLDGRGSKLMPDKIHFGTGFACDGPGRGGTCDISAWDSFYLATFWMLNTGAWISFYFHWKHLTLWPQNTLFQFDESSTHLNGWFRDYLWFNSTSLINGYNTHGVNDVSVWAWVFLGAHLCWATGFMFLISWRGYWQELIDIILYMHLKTPILYNLWNGATAPVALSIVQARFVGLVHFSTGFILTYAAFIVGATS